jgi:hypothetical protein
MNKLPEFEQDLLSDNDSISDILVELEDNQNGNDNHFIIEDDYIQSFLNLENFGIYNIILLIGMVAACYFVLDWKLFLHGIYIFVIVLILRFIISQLTIIKKKDGKKHFQISAQVALFTIIAFIAAKNKKFLMNNDMIFVISVLAYSIFTISTKTNTTADVIFTLLLVNSLYKWKSLKQFLPSIKEDSNFNYYEQNYSR